MVLCRGIDEGSSIGEAKLPQMILNKRDFIFLSEYNRLEIAFIDGNDEWKSNIGG
jgi:hypothetical protein